MIAKIADQPPKRGIANFERVGIDNLPGEACSLQQGRTGAVVHLRVDARGGPVSVRDKRKLAQDRQAARTGKCGEKQPAFAKLAARTNERAGQVVDHAKAEQVHDQIEFTDIFRTGLVELAKPLRFHHRAGIAQPIGEKPGAISDDPRRRRFELHEVEPFGNIIGQRLGKKAGTLLQALAIAGPRELRRCSATVENTGRGPIHLGRAVPRLLRECKSCHTRGVKFGSQVAESIRPVVDLVYPPRCPLCGDAVADQGGLCIECWSQIEVPGEPSCKSCLRPVGGGNEKVCFACHAHPPRHSGVHAATIYNDASRKLILAYKHGRKITLARMLARMIASRLPEMESGRPLLVPVPLHRWRLWHRGFNQAALLAGELARMGQGELLVDGLVRTKRTPRLGGLGRAEREAALMGAIAVRPSRASRLAGWDVVLVDDVLTSGATSDACVAALLDKGARSVSIACFARVIDGSVESGAGPAKNTTPEAVKTPGAT